MGAHFRRVMSKRIPHSRLEKKQAGIPPAPGAALRFSGGRPERLALLTQP